jgi:hypothetical protein
MGHIQRERLRVWQLFGEKVLHFKLLVGTDIFEIAELSTFLAAVWSLFCV